MINWAKENSVIISAVLIFVFTTVVLAMVFRSCNITIQQENDLGVLCAEKIVEKNIPISEMDEVYNLCMKSKGKLP